MNIHIHYSDRAEFTNDDIPVLVNISKNYGDIEVKTWGIRSGAIDLLNIIELSISWGIYKIIKSYASGFLGEDWFKNLGKSDRKKVSFQIRYLRDYLQEVFHDVVSKRCEVQKAISIVEYVDDVVLYVVLNHANMNEQLIDSLPNDLARAIVYITTHEFEEDSGRVVQLFPNFQSSTWDYLFLPTREAFGHYVDKYFDFSDKNIHMIKSTSDFIERFEIDHRDLYKFIITYER